MAYLTVNDVQLFLDAIVSVGLHMSVQCSDLVIAGREYTYYVIVWCHAILDFGRFKRSFLVGFKAGSIFCIDNVVNILHFL